MHEIIIVRYNEPDFENDCIRSVLEHTHVPYHLTVYDNYDRDANLSTVWNDLIRRSDAEYICLLNSDTVVEDNWLGKLTDGLTENTGAIGPVTNNCGTHQQGFSKDDRQDVITKCTTLSGFCLVFPRKVWETVKFNENYKLYGEDTEWCEEVKKAGYELSTHYGVHIFHHGGASGHNRPDLLEVKQEASQRFQEYKHGSK